MKVSKKMTMDTEDMSMKNRSSLAYDYTLVIPFDFGHRPVERDLMRLIWMLKESVRSYQYLSRLINAELVIVADPQYMGLIKKFVPSCYKFESIRRQERDTLLWSHYKFTAAERVVRTKGAFIGDFDITFTKEEASRISDKILSSKTDLMYLCPESDVIGKDMFNGTNKINQNAYSYHCMYTLPELTITRPYNAGFIVTSDVHQFLNIKEAAVRYMQKLVGERTFRKKGSFSEGAFEQVLIPDYYKKQENISLFYDHLVAAREDDEIIHLWGRLKSDGSAIKKFSKISKTYENIKI